MATGVRFIICLPVKLIVLHVSYGLKLVSRFRSIHMGAAVQLLEPLTFPRQQPSLQVSLELPDPGGEPQTSGTRTARHRSSSGRVETFSLKGVGCCQCSMVEGRLALCERRSWRWRGVA